MLGRLLAILGLVGLAVTQPILDLLGSSPSTFDQYGIEGYAIVWFAVLIAVVPAVGLFAVGEAVRFVDETAGELVHRAMIALLAAGFGVLLAKAITSSTVLTTLLGLLVGAGILVLYARTEAMGMWLRLMAAANLLFLAQFALLSPAADWIESATSTPEVIVPIEPARGADETDESAAAGGEPAEVSPDVDDERPPSVFILVFDELPTQTLLDEDGRIDAEQFPNFAALADDATFHRRHTTNSPFTHAAIPALFDGKEPQGGPTWTEHPENLYNIFAGTHHLIASEVLTRLCGFDVCGDLTPPPPPRAEPTPPDDEASDETDEAAAPTTSAAPPTPADADGARWGDLLGATWDVWLDRLSPVTGSDARGLDDFQEDFGATPTTVLPVTTTAPPTTSSVAGDEAEPQSPTLTVPQDERSEEEQALARFFQLLPGAQPERLSEFLDVVRPSDQPVFGYLHLILPHQPWVVREDGARYDIAGDRYDYEADNDSEWPTRVSRQRHVLQTRYTDQVLGQFIAHLQVQGYYDDALIVVLGDHGVSFVPGELSRTLSVDGLPSIAYVPLLIKAPGQTEGVVDDQNLSIVDIPLTIADILDIGLPWDTVGAAAGSPEVLARDRGKQIYEFTSPTEFDTPPVIDFDDGEAFARLIENRHPAPASIDDPLSALYDDIAGADLRGLAADDVFGPVDGSATIDALDRLRTPGEEPPLGEIAGRAPGAPDDATVVVAVNDVIVGVSPLYVRGGAPDSFVVLLPADALDASANVVRVGLRDAGGQVRELAVPD